MLDAGKRAFSYRFIEAPLAGVDMLLTALRAMSPSYGQSIKVKPTQISLSRLFYLF